MSRSQSGELSPMICVLAVLALSLIVYVLLVLFPIVLKDEPLRATNTHSQGTTRQAQQVDHAVRSSLPVVSGKRELEVQSVSHSGGPVYQPRDTQAHELVTTDKDTELYGSETATERSARSIRETLGIKVKQSAQAAVIVELKLAKGCLTDEDAQTILPIWYRFDSPTIRTSSVNELRSLVAQFRLCENSEFHMKPSTQTDVENNSGLVQLRFNELKYFFTQSNVPKLALHYQENP